MAEHYGFPAYFLMRFAPPLWSTGTIGGALASIIWRGILQPHKGICSNRVFCRRQSHGKSQAGRYAAGAAIGPWAVVLNISIPVKAILLSFTFLSS